MKKLSKEKRDRLLITCLGAVTIIVGLYYGVVSTQKTKLTNLSKAKAEKASKLSNAQRLATKTPEFRQSLEDTLARLKSMESTMASGDMYSWVILTVNNFKDSSKIDIPQFSREVSADVGMFSKFPYRAAVFHVRGTAYFHDFGKFVADFENNFPLMRIQNIELDTASAGAAQEDPEKLAFKIEIVALVNPNTH
jgi:Tfp pilus assembly protein PilO